MSERQIISVTETALEKVLELRAGEEDANELALRIEVVGIQGVDYSYDLAFEVLSEADSEDIPTHVGGGLTVLVPGRDAPKLEGATLDVPSSSGQAGLVLRNPNRPDLGPNATLDLDGSIEEQVQEVLVKRINPSIAAHGGYAELVRVEGSTVLIKLGGGCQGCGMANATVTAGIEKTLTELLDGVDHVLDITDHTSGENPYFAAT
tara:strand:- start:6849 stop:7466 length:618 start_codon:yes stop_codon:yes gene_type:complete